MYGLYQRIAQTMYPKRHLGTALSCFIPTAVKSKLPILKTGQALERVLSNSRKIPHKAMIKVKLLQSFIVSLFE